MPRPAEPGSPTTCSASSISRPRPTNQSRPAPTKSAWSSPTTAEGSPRAGNVTLYYDGTAVGTGRVDATQPMVFSADETTDIGYESGTTVTPDYDGRNSRFTGKIN
jgi:hypothetical protein